MQEFTIWLMMVESGRLDHGGFNAEFRRQLAELLPRVSDSGRRASLEAMREFDFLAYILTSLRNAGLLDQQEREEAAHDVAVYLLVQPGQLFAGYNPSSSGPMEARFRLAVQNAVRNVLRSRARRAARSPAISGHRADDLLATVQDSCHGRDDDAVVGEFREFLRDEIGEQAVNLLDLRLDGMSLRRIARQPGFLSLGDWGVRQLMGRVRAAARAFVRSHGDEGLLRALERLAPADDVQEWLLAV
jgi:hypothetical protein